MLRYLWHKIPERARHGNSWMEEACMNPRWTLEAGRHLKQALQVLLTTETGDDTQA